MAEAAKSAVPSYKLYGESDDLLLPEILHCESVAERSILHNWEIKPHRHHDLLQLMHVRHGTARMTLEGTERELPVPCVVLIPALVVHGFAFGSDVNGWVVTLPDRLLDEFGTSGETLRSVLAEAQVIDCADGKREIGDLFRQIADEFGHAASGRHLALRSLLGLILVWLARRSLSEQRRLAVADRDLERLRRLRELVEVHFRAKRSNEFYAAELGLTSTHLNRICRAKTGRSLLQVVHDRVALEAKRDLVYTSMTVNQIAYALGFEDPAYFTRFFTRKVGASPSDFRRDARASLGRPAA